MAVLFRFGCVSTSLLLGALAARAAHAQQLDAAVAGALTLTQPLSPNAPGGDVAGRVTIDPSQRPLAVWGGLGLRWEGPLATDPHPIANLGLRLRRRFWRLALGIHQDVAYGSLARSDGPRSAQPPTPPDTIPRAEPTTAGLDSNNFASTRAGYSTQSVTDLVGSADWAIGPAVLGIETGWRLSGPARGQPWYGARLAAPLVPAFALVVGVDRRYDRVSSPASARLTLGLQWRAAPWRRAAVVKPRPAARDSAATMARTPDAAVSVLRLANGIRLSFFAPSAGRVEVRGDLTDWMAAPLERTANGRWEVDLVAAPGVHRLAVRVDGRAWQPPPGLPAGPDGYGGTVGVLVVEP